MCMTPISPWICFSSPISKVSSYLQRPMMPIGRYFLWSFSSSDQPCKMIVVGFTGQKKGDETHDLARDVGWQLHSPSTPSVPLREGYLRFKGSPTGSPITHLLLGEAQTLCPPMQAKWEDLFAQTNANSLPCLFLSSSPSCCIAPDW